MGTAEARHAMCESALRGWYRISLFLTHTFQSWLPFTHCP